MKEKLVGTLLRTVAIVAAGLGISTGVQAQVRAPQPLTTELMQNAELRRQNEALRSQFGQLQQTVGAHNQQCSSIKGDDAAKLATCEKSADNVKAAIAAYNRSWQAHDEALKSVGAPPKLIPSGNGLVGGTIWIAGYNVQNPDPKLVAKAREMLREQMRLAGIPYDEAIDFNRYNFVIGIAHSTVVWRDLANRVVFDQLRKGNYSREHQDAYNTLKGRSFDRLGCHSNGAMICLAALSNKDVAAKHVVLYGPQITPGSLKLWDELVRSGKIGSLEIRVNRGDPVPPVSFLLSPGEAVTAAAHPGMALALFTGSGLSQAIRTAAPSASVKVGSCPGGLDLKCHQMSQYKSNE